MLLNQRFTWGAVAIAMLGVTATAVARDPASAAQNKLLAKRAAEADCYRKLAETVYGVKITSDTYVRDFVAESDDIRTGIDTFVKGIRLSSPRYYEDGVAEVDGEVTVAKLITTLKTIHTKSYKGNRVTTTDIEQIKKRVQKDVIRVTGTGAPRPELPPNLPEGVEDIITPLPPGYQTTMRIPAIWRTVGPQARLMAERGAEVDAMRKLLEQIQGLRLTSDTLVRDFITESDEIRTQAQGIVVGAYRVSKYLHDEDLIVEVTMEVPVSRVLTKIKELHAEHYRGNKVTTTDITNIKKTIHREKIRATGSGVPKAQFLSRAASAGYEMPPWMSRTIEATGQATDRDMNTAQGKLKAARAATIDAMRKLTEQVYGLEISANTTVHDFIAANDDITTQVDAVISGAVAGPANFDGDVATVRVTMPAAEVWSVVHQQQTIISRRG